MSPTGRERLLNLARTNSVLRSADIALEALREA
jgi:hypothetical protein